MEHIKEKPDQPAQIPNSTPNPPSNGFLHSSVGKESVCNAGDPGSIPRSGRSPGEGIGYPLQYSRASLVAQLIKNPPTMQKTWVPSLGWEDSLEEGMATHSSILAWRIPGTEEPGGLQSMGLERVRYDWATNTFTPRILQWESGCDKYKFTNALSFLHPTNGFLKGSYIGEYGVTLWQFQSSIFKLKKYHLLENMKQFHG